MRYASNYTCVFIVLLSAGVAQAQLEWRVSVKFFVDANGDRVSVGNLVTNQDVLDHYDRANELLDGYGRGYRFNVVEIVDLPTSLSSWFSQPVNGTTRSNLQTAVENQPTLYARNNAAMNVYILGSGGGGWCARPQGTSNMVSILGQGANMITPFHEAGHVLGLCHTHGCVSSSSNDCDTIVSDDIDDTIGDCSLWASQDEVAQGVFGVNYGQLSTFNRDRVDNVWRNVMSYHAPDGSTSNRDRLTDDQLDRMTDIANTTYDHLASGKTHFVDGTNGGTQDGSSVNPAASLFGGLLLALGSSSEDIILIRQGTYNETPTISIPVTLRSSRGSATIGR